MAARHSALALRTALFAFLLAAAVPFSVIAVSATAEYTGVDVGAPALAGRTTLITADSAYDVTAAGRDIYGTSDQFHFAYKEHSGDFDIHVRVSSLTAAHPWSKAGLMARESMAPDSREVSVFATPAAGYEFQYRTATGVFVQKIDSVARVSYPNTWVRLKRAGDVFTSYTSADGVTWVPLGTITLALPGSVSVGMAATSHNVKEIVLAQFRDLAVIAEYAGLDVGAPALAGRTTVVTAGSAYDVTAAGSDIYGTSDQFHFAYKVRSGDFDLRVRVASLTAVNLWSKAGLMARESMAPDSREVSVFATPAAGYEFQARAETGVFVQKMDSVAQVSYPNTWVRLKRAGDVFTSYTSADGVTWVPLGTITLALPGSVLMGMAATSHDVSQSVLAQFRDLGPAAQ